MTGPMTAIALEVVTGPALVQDAGRPGFMHQGIPPGGALVPELLAAANLRAGNPWGAAALEAFGPLELIPRGGPLWVATEDAAWLAPEGERLTVPRPQRACVRYLAVRGGLQVPEVLGGRGTLLVASLGGFEGRGLRRGDLLPCLASAPAAPTREPPAIDLTQPVRVIPGPDHARFPAAALELLLSGEFQVSPSTDRTGMRLRGPALPRLDDDTASPTPMVAGSIEIPASGEPIVLGPDHPTTGGYPVLATVIRADLGRLRGRRPGAAVHFQAMDPIEARAAWSREQAWRNDAHLGAHR